MRDFPAFGGTLVARNSVNLIAENQAEDTEAKSGMRIMSGSLPPAWRSFLFFCKELGNGEIHELKIQDGLPVIAQAVTRRVRFLP
jgi:hypothetical protein